MGCSGIKWGCAEWVARKIGAALPPRRCSLPHVDGDGQRCDARQLEHLHPAEGESGEEPAGVMGVVEWSVACLAEDCRERCSNSADPSSCTYLTSTRNSCMPLPRYSTCLSGEAAGPAGGTQPLAASIAAALPLACRPLQLAATALDRQAAAANAELAAHRRLLGAAGSVEAGPSAWQAAILPNGMPAAPFCRATSRRATRPRARSILASCVLGLHGRSQLRA